MVKFLFCNSSQEDVSEQIGFVFKDMSFVIGFHLFCGDFSFSLTEHIGSFSTTQFIEGTVNNGISFGGFVFLLYLCTRCDKKNTD